MLRNNGIGGAKVGLAQRCDAGCNQDAKRQGTIGFLEKSSISVAGAAVKSLWQILLKNQVILQWR